MRAPRVRAAASSSGAAQRAVAVEEGVNEGRRLVDGAGESALHRSRGHVRRGASQCQQRSRLALGHRDVGAARPAGDGDLRGGRVGDAFGEQERRGRFRPLGEEAAQHPFREGGGTEGGGQHDFREARLSVAPRLRRGHARGGDGHLRGRAHATRARRRHPRGQVRGPDQRRRARALGQVVPGRAVHLRQHGTRGAQGLGERIEAATEAADDAHAGDDGGGH